MSSSQIRSQLERKRSQRVDAEKRASTARSKESDKRSTATKARSAASSTHSDSTRSLRLREADRYERDANAAAKESADWQKKASGLLHEEARLQKQLADAEESERKTADRKRAQSDAMAERRRAQEVGAAHAETARLRTEMANRFAAHDDEIARLRQPKQETLRVLVLTAAGQGDLRLGREQKRIQDAVRFASGRENVRLDVRPAATGDDLLNGLTQTVPHVVHFSGHGNETVIVFEEDEDRKNVGVPVSGELLGRALQSVDERPLLVVLNACKTERQAERLCNGGASFAIGHSESIGDEDAINYAARFYASLVDAQSIGSAHDLARTALEMMGLPGSDLPQLFAADGLDPYQVRLVLPEAEPPRG